MRHSLHLFVFLMLVGAVLARDTDYSKRGGEFTILKGIRLNVGHLAFKEKRKIEVVGKSLEAPVFTFTATVTIQTRESVVSQGSVWEDLPLEYELIVAPDTKNEVHDLLIEDIYRHWTSPETKNSWIFDRSVYWKGQSYLIFDGSIPKLVWFDHRVIQLKFIKFLDKRKSGFGAEQSFWERKIRFYDGKTRLKLEFLVNGLQNEFVKLHDQGFFVAPR